MTRRSTRLRPETNATTVSGAATTALDRVARGRQHPGVHRLVRERRQGAVEVERDEQQIGCRDAGDGSRTSSARSSVMRSLRSAVMAGLLVALADAVEGVEEGLATSRATSFSTHLAAQRPHAAALLGGGISMARMIASFSPSMSWGLMRTALPSSSAAPANSLSTQHAAVVDAGGDVLLGDEVHAVAERGDEHDVGGEEQRHHLLARVGLVQVADRGVAHRVVVAVDAADGELDLVAQLHVRRDALPARARDLHEGHVLDARCWPSSSSSPYAFIRWRMPLV